MNSKSVKEGGIKSMYSKSKRFIASFLAVLMAVCMLPADVLGGVGVVNAAAGDISATPASDDANTEFVTGTDVSITLSIEEGNTSDIYYLVKPDSETDKYDAIENGTERDEADGAINSNTLTLDKTTTFKAFTVDGEGKYANVKPFDYAFTAPTKPTVTANPDGTSKHTFTGATGEVTLSASAGSVYYVLSTDSDYATTSVSAETIVTKAQEATAAIQITEATTIKAVAKDGNNVGDVQTFEYDVTAPTKPTVTANPDGTSKHTFTGATGEVTLSASAGSVYYVLSTDSDYATTSVSAETIVTKAQEATAAIQITEATTIKAVAKDGNNVGDVQTFEYDVTTTTPPTPSVLKNRRLNMEGVPANTYTEDFTKNGFTLLAPFAVDGNNKTDSSVTPNVKYTQRFKMQNGTDYTDGKVTRSIMFTTQGAASVIIWAMAGNSSAENKASAEISKLENGSLVKVSDFNDGNTIGGNSSDFGQYTASVTEAGTYYINANNGKSLNIYNIEVRYPGVGTADDDYDDDVLVKVSFNVDGGLSVADQDVVAGGKCSEPATIKDGYVLEGWYTDEALTSKFDFSTSITSETTLYAKWVEDTDRVNNVLNMALLPNGDYAVEFIKNGFTILGKSGSTVSVTTATPPDDEPTYTKILKTNGKSSKDSRLISFKISEDSILKVVAAAAGSDARTLYVGTTIPQNDIGNVENIPADAVEVKKSSDTNIFTATKDLTASEETTYYMYTTNGFNIYYISVTPKTNNGETVTLTFMNGTTEVGTKDVTKGSTPYTLSEAGITNPTKDNCVFKGWTEKATGETSAADVVGTVIPDGNKTLYAVWANVYTVTLDNTGASETSFDGFPKEDVEEGTTISLPTPTPADSTKVFGGWIESGATGDDVPTYTDEYTVTKTVTLVPTFVDPNSIFTVTRDYGYPETGSDTNKTDTFPVTKTGDKATVALERLGTPERDGWTFVNWVIVAEDGAEGAPVTADVEITGNTTFLAKWTEDVNPTTYSVAFETANGGALTPTVSDKTGNPIADLTKVAENTIIVLPNTTETKPEGKGDWVWKEYKNDTFVAEHAEGDEYTVSSDVTFKGDWTDGQNPDDEGDEENWENDWWDNDKAEIKKANSGKIPEGLWMAGLYQDGSDEYEEGYYYNAGAKVTPDTYGESENHDGIRVYYHTHLLTYKTDYTVSYKNNVNAAKSDAAKAPTITISGKGSYSGKVTKTFTINPYYIDWTDSDCSSYVLAKKNNKAQQVVPTLTDGYHNAKDKWITKKLKNKKDFDVVYYKEAEYEKVGYDEDGNKLKDKLGEIALTAVTEPGDYVVAANGKGNYCGTEIFYVTVLASDAKLTSKLKVTVEKVKYDQAAVDAAGFNGFEPKVTVKDGKTELTALAYDTDGKATNEAAADYSIEYGDNRVAGTGYVIIRPVIHESTATGEDGKTTTTYTQSIYGTRRVSFKISGNPIKSAKVTYDGDLTYKSDSSIIDSNKIKLAYKGAPLTPYHYDETAKKYVGDYEITNIINNWSAGNATVYIYGRNSYEGTLTKKFKIAPYDISNATVTLAGADPKDAGTLKAVFSKGGCYPVVNVTCKFGEGENAGDYWLYEGEDYTISYKNNNNFKKTAQIIIKGKGDYKGTLKKEFAFDEKDLAGLTLSVPDVPLLTRAGKYGSKPVITDNSGVKTVNLAVKKDYTLEYFDVTPKSTETEQPVESEPAQQAGEGDGTTTTTEGTPITDINRFTATKDTVIKVVATAVSGSGYKGSISATYKVHEKDFNKVTVKITPQVYAGKAVTLKAEDITVTPKNESALTLKTKGSTEDGYYIESYTGNNKKGSAKVTLVGTGSYAGSKTVTFKITARKMEWATLTKGNAEKTIESITNAIKGLFN